MKALKRHPEGTLLKIHVQPKARRTELAGFHGEALKIRVAAPALEGRANRALLEFLARKLTLKKSDLCLFSGEKSREKTVLVKGLPPEELSRRLGLE
ncbi:MAG: YggU family protein [Thermodesulfatator sp.]|nr:MAG: YggU family protein [Thermodesulfatator sp.]